MNIKIESIHLKAEHSDCQDANKSLSLPYYATTMWNSL